MPHLMGRNWSDLIKYNNVTLIGIMHYRIEFSVLVRNYVLHEKPDCICVELPQSLRKEVIQAVNQFPQHSVIIYETAAKENSVLIMEGSDGILEAVRSANEFNIPVHYVDPLTLRYPVFFDRIPEAYSLDAIGQTVFLNEVVRKHGFKFDGGEENENRERFIASRIQEAAREYKKVLFVGGMAHVPGILGFLAHPQPLPLMKTGIKAAFNAPLHPDSLKKGFTEIPRITEIYEKWRKSPAGTGPVNRHELILDLMEKAAAYYSSQTKQDVPEYVRMTWAKFLRKWLKTTGRLLPDMYHLVSAARSSLDEDFAYHVHEYLSEYAWSNDPFDPAAVVLNEDNLLFFGHKIILHKKLRSFFNIPKRYKMQAVVGRKWKEHLKKKWETADPSEVDICSYPPEDVEIERWGEALMKHANHMLQTAQHDSEPFSADFGLGPDIRETLRRAYEGRIYVKTDDQGGIDFGSIVVIFDEDKNKSSYPFQMTWLGEHSQESDMAFYSTPPGAEIVGPGISRLEHGGFMLSYPPMRMFDVWLDSSFDFVPTLHERLLVAGLAYSEKPGIVYVAKHPPLPKWKKLAKNMGKRIIYIPIGSLNPLHVKRMRTFHMLQNKGIRNSAKDFLKK